MSADDVTTKPVYGETNGFPMAGDYTLHMDLKAGDLANRIVTVGATARAEKISAYFDADRPTRRFTSSRGFVTFTGFVEGVEVSIVAIGIGVAMMDLFIREARAIVTGPMVIIRFGTCGGLSPQSLPGSVAVASLGAAYICRNPDHFLSANDSNKVAPYIYFKPVAADAELSASLDSHLSSALTRVEGCKGVTHGMNVTCDSFYSSQGRHDERFVDDNQSLFDELYERYPSAGSMEMETFFLFHLAQSCTIPIRTAAAAMVVSNRMSGEVVNGEVLDIIEVVGGHAVLMTVAKAAL